MSSVDLGHCSYSLPDMEADRPIVMTVSVHELRNCMSGNHQFFVHVTYGRVSVLLWRRCDTLCISGSMDDVMFVHNDHD